MAKKSSKISVVSIVMVALVAVFLVLGIVGVCVDEYLKVEVADKTASTASFEELTDISEAYQDFKSELKGAGAEDVTVEYADKLSAAVAFGYLAVIFSAVCLVMVILSLFFQGGLWGLLTLIAIIMISTTSAYCALDPTETLKFGAGAILLAVGSIGAGAATVVKKFVK